MGVAALAAAVELDSGRWQQVVSAGGTNKDLTLSMFHDHCCDDQGGTTKLRGSLPRYPHPSLFIIPRHQKGSLLRPVVEEAEDVLVLNAGDDDRVSDDDEVQIIKVVPGRSPTIKAEAAASPSTTSTPAIGAEAAAPTSATSTPNKLAYSKALVAAAALPPPNPVPPRRRGRSRREKEVTAMMVLFDIRCSVCGVRSHFHRNLNGTTSCPVQAGIDDAHESPILCFYQRCLSPSMHVVAACPWLQGRCRVCKCRGHQGGCDYGDELSMEALREEFQATASLGVYTSLIYEDARWSFYPTASDGTFPHPLFVLDTLSVRDAVKLIDPELHFHLMAKAARLAAAVPRPKKARTE